MKSYQHEVDMEEMRYADLQDYWVVSLNVAGEVHLKNSAGNRHFTTIRKLEKEMTELGDDNFPFHEGKLLQRQIILDEVDQLYQKF